MVCFVSGKDNLNKAHVKFLESYCHEEAKKADRTELMNGCSPTRSTLSPSERDFSLQFFDEMGLILGTLGYPIFSKIKKAEKQEEIFYCKKKGAEATGNLTEEGFVVYAGSTANLEERPSITKWVKSKRDELIEKRILIQKSPTLYEFSKDFVFTSPSIASAVVVGGNANGWLEWKNLNGTTMDELKRQNSS
jgi:hypothetical protein